jgi:predicted enzyme related to lactoylglutathione lyase
VLTPTEWRVLDALRHGMPRREIAERRGTSLDAVKDHARNIAAKLGVESSRDLRHCPGHPIGTRVPPLKETGSVDASLRLGAIGQISLLATDTQRVERFYSDTLGLPHLFTFGDLAFFDAAGTRLYIQTKPASEWRPSSILYFRVDDIEGTKAELERRGVAFSGAPHMIHRHAETGVEEWMAFFDDSEGNVLALLARVPASGG